MIALSLHGWVYYVAWAIEHRCSPPLNTAISPPWMCAAASSMLNCCCDAVVEVCPTAHWVAGSGCSSDGGKPTRSPTWLAPYPTSLPSSCGPPALSGSGEVLTLHFSSSLSQGAKKPGHGCSSSTLTCRRNHFEVFYRCHIVGFLGTVLFAVMHYQGTAHAHPVLRSVCLPDSPSWTSLPAAASDSHLQPASAATPCRCIQYTCPGLYTCPGRMSNVVLWSA